MIAVLVVADTVALEVAVTQQIFGPPMPSLAAVTGDVESPYDIILCGEKRQFVLPCGTDVGELTTLDAMLDADTVIVPGVQQPLTSRSEALLAALRGAYGAGARMVSFCGGAFLLGYAGILDSRRATTHWILAKEFREAFPSVRLDIDHLYIDDGRVHTSGGIFSATDLALHLIALDRGHAYANDTARILVSAPHRPGGQAQFVKGAIRTDGQRPITSLLRWLHEHVDQPLTLTDLARHEQSVNAAWSATSAR